MILAVDPGYAKCGWAVIRPRTARVVAIGVVLTEQDKRVDKSTDRARRTAFVIGRLQELAKHHACSTIAAEQALQHGAAAAIAANLLPWGALTGLAVALGAALHEVPAKLWQHAVMPGCTKIDYEQLERKLGAFVAGQAELELLAIARGHRTHALDAVGVGLLVALTKSATEIVARGAA